MTLTATLIAVDLNGTLMVDPSVQQIKMASSIHVFAFSSSGDILVVESEGAFTIDTLDEVHQRAKFICNKDEMNVGEAESTSEDISMRLDDVSKLDTVLLDAVQRKVAKDQRWKKSMG